MSLLMLLFQSSLLLLLLLVHVRDGRLQHRQEFGESANRVVSLRRVREKGHAVYE